MEKYLIALDMDGTLLTKTKEISLLTKNYLRDLAKQGHIIVLASGRPYRTLKPYYEELELKSPLICYNGVYVFDPSDTNFPTQLLSFPKDEVIDFIHRVKPYITNFMCETNDDIYIDKDDKYLDVFFFYEGMNVHEGNIEDILNSDVMTCIARVKDNITEEEKKETLKGFPKQNGINLRYWTGSPYFELFYDDATKGACVRHIADHYGINKDHIIVFGDALNDLEMLKEAGYGIAMKNGKEEFIKEADYISLEDNEHDGIYYTLKALFEGKLK